MWDLSSRNRGIFVLISLLSVCAILYNAWGPILALTISIIIVIYVCYSLLTNDSVLSPQTFNILNKYVKEIAKDINAYSNNITYCLKTTIPKLNIILNKTYENYIADKMNRFRKNSYQLSNDDHDLTSRNLSRFDLTTNQLSPIPKNDYQENIIFNNQRLNDYNVNKITSTPLVPLRKDANLVSNGAIGLFTPNRPLRQDTQHGYGPNHTSLRANETVFSPEGSPWGTSISPKMRSKASGIKTVQTVAGPLLASTRYNIDPKVYSDVTSPGLSTRLAKYATEANNKLTHQSQYGTGQFPKVNLSASPLPLLSLKNTKIRSPVTVRIAPPEASRYSPPERQKLISDVCKAESRAGPSVVQVLREISLKRHASREDVSSDLVKKQRTEGLFDENIDGPEEAKQKRTREDSPNTEEEILAKNNQLRPVKKTKTPSCYDVLNSLSSSNQYSSGIKRKASTLDLSRSGTPDIEKHFKASETVRTVPKVSVSATDLPARVRRASKHDLSDKSPPRIESEIKTLREQPVVQVKGILKTQSGKDAPTVEKEQHSSNEMQTAIEEERETQVEKKSSPINFTDKLFMKAEPQTNERLRTLIQEQGNIRARFTNDDVDEIKKEDIVNMRQTSMRARLQSMFDAISGKSKKINPDVIIHAEGTSEPNGSPITAPAGLATLSSTTSTTNINTSPIATSAVAPTVADSKLGTTTATKHVTFNLPSLESSVESQNGLPKAISSTGFTASSIEAGKQISEPIKLTFGTGTAIPSTSTPPSVSGSTSFSAPNNQSTISAPTAIKSSIAATSSVNLSTNVAASVTSAVSKSLSPNSSLTFTPPNLGNVSRNSGVISSQSFGVTTTPASVLGSTNFTTETKKSIETDKTSPKSSVPMPNFSFGVSKMSSPSSVFSGNSQSTSVVTQSQTPTSNTSAATTPIPSFAPKTVAQNLQSAFSSSTAASTVPSSNTTATTSSLFSFGKSNSAPQSTGSGGFSFTSNTNAAKSQIPSFSSPNATFSAQTTQNLPSYANSINFQSVQSTPIVTATTAQNVPTFGSNLTGNQSLAAFGSAVTTSQSAPTFGTVASSAPPPTYGNTSTTSSSFAFGNTAAQTSTNSGFGTNANSTSQSTVTTAATKPSFSFGATTTPSTKSGFTFNANKPQTTNSSGGIQAPAASNQISVFGAAAPSNNATVFGTPSTTAPPAFGATPTTATPVFGAPTITATPVFGVNSTTATPLFGSSATPTTSTIFNSSTNQSNTFGTPKTTAPPSFESHTSDPNFSYAGANMGKSSLFSGTSFSAAPNTAAPTASTAAFAGNAMNKGSFTGWGGTPSFGNSAPATNASGFGGQTPTTTAFGTQNSNVKQTPQGPPPAFGSTSSSFSTTTTAPPAFGANTVTSSGFGSSATTFGAQNSTAAPSFGATAANAAPAFGSNVATPFGGQSQTSAPSFGAQNSTAPTFGATNNNQNSTFAFGANQTQAQQNSGFSFSGTTSSGNNNNAAAATTPFQFGGAPAKTDGFNFNASTTTPNINFGATASSSFGSPAQGTNMFGASSPAVPAGGMFSIGAGSTAPRSRSSRTRRQR